MNSGMLKVIDCCIEATLSNCTVSSDLSCHVGCMKHRSVVDFNLWEEAKISLYSDIIHVSSHFAWTYFYYRYHNHVL